MHDLLIVLKPCSIYDPHNGRRDLRVGTRINIDSDIAAPLVKSGHLQRIVSASPLFANSTDPPRKPMKALKRIPEEPNVG